MLGISKTAILSSCGIYRYSLGRAWDDSLPPVVWLMLNPSTADSNIDDPTIRRCMGFARAWGYGGIKVVNPYGFRSPNPTVMRSAIDPVGPDNDRYVLGAVTGEAAIAAWGVHGATDRVRAVWNLIKDAARTIECLGRTKDGSPKHPLFLPAKVSRLPFFVKEY